MISKIKKDQGKRIEYRRAEESRAVRNIIRRSAQIEIKIRSIGEEKYKKTDREGVYTTIRNRCIETGRGRGVDKRYGLSRIITKDEIEQGRIRGQRRGNW